MTKVVIVRTVLLALLGFVIGTTVARCVDDASAQEVVPLNQGAAYLMGCLPNGCKQIGESYPRRKDCSTAMLALNTRRSDRIAKGLDGGAEFHCRTMVK